MGKEAAWLLLAGRGRGRIIPTKNGSVPFGPRKERKKEETHASEKN